MIWTSGSRSSSSLRIHPPLKTLVCDPGARKSLSLYGPAMRVRDTHDEEEFPPRRPFGGPAGERVAEPVEDDELALPCAALAGAGCGQAPITRS
jgi:hypothetical protein